MSPPGDMLEDFWHLPEPSFEEKATDLQRRLGRHPIYKDQWGRDPQASDSDNGLSDDAMDDLVAKDRLEMENRLKANKRARSVRGTRQSDKAESRSRRPTRLSTAAEGSSTKGGKEAKVSRAPAAQDALPSPVTQLLKTDVIEENQSDIGPVAGPSGHNSKTDRQRRVISSPPPVHPSHISSPARAATCDAEEIDQSSASDEGTSTTKKPRLSKSSIPTSSRTLSTVSTSTAARPGGRGRRKGRVTMEQAIEEAQKIKVEELNTRFADISSFIDHLASFELSRPGKLLQGCRIVFVNADHWKASKTTRNRLDQGLRLELGIVARQGGALVKPEHFVGAPPDVVNISGRELDIESRAVDEGWTTHIIGFHPSNYRPPTFAEVLACLGGDEGLSADDLGPYVKVVTFPWVSQCVKERKRQSEWEFAITGDPREATSSRPSSTKSSPVKRPPSAKDRRQGRRRKDPDDVAETSGESQAEDDEGQIKGAISQVPPSPFGSQDYPVGEQPAPDLESNVAPTNGGGDAHVATHAQPEPVNPLEGLEEQSKLVKELGDEEVDDLLDENLVIYRGVEDDDETDHEEEDQVALREGREIVRADVKEKRSDCTNYVVNREFKPPGQDVGPNDATADVLLQLSEFHKGDQWRERGYRQAAGVLRRYKHKVTDYKDLVKIRGIGAQIAEKIVEINRTGTHRKLLNELPEDKAARLFSGVYGIGLAMGHELAKCGARTIQDLDKPHFYSMLSTDQKIGLRFYEDLLERIPRAEVTELYNTVLQASRAVDPKLQVECMGSYRRGQPNSGDIDILVTRDPTEDGKTHSGAIAKIYKILRSKNFFQHILTQSDDWSDLSCKVNGLCKLPDGKMRRIDILGVPWDDMPAALIYFTGNDHFNRSLRLKARHMGYSLNQKCLSKSVIRGKGGEKLTEGTRIHVKSEREIFEILRVPWKRPEERIPS
ncbi:hypothetical protein JCM3766R1_006052 [Sporobolomyces carnicolor]